MNIEKRRNGVRVEIESYEPISLRRSYEVIQKYNEMRADEIEQQGDWIGSVLMRLCGPSAYKSWVRERG